MVSEFTMELINDHRVTARVPGAGFYAKYGFVAAPDNGLLLFMGFRPIGMLLDAEDETP